MLYGYFVAASDGAVGRSVEDDGTNRGEVVVKGIDPYDDLVPIEVLLTRTPATEIRSDPRHGTVVYQPGDGEFVVASLTDTLRDALAVLNPHDIADFVATNARNVLSGLAAPDVLTEFLTQMSALARNAIQTDQHLYCWIAS